MAEELGYEVRVTALGHLRCAHPSGALVFVGPERSTARSMCNTEASLRRGARQPQREGGGAPALDTHKGEYT